MADDNAQSGAFHAGFDFARLLGDPGFREWWKAAGGGNMSRVIPAAADTTVEDILCRLRQPSHPHADTYLVLADETAPYGFRIWKEMQ